MLLSTLLPILPFILANAQAQRQAYNQPHPAQLQHEEREYVQLDERGMPITTTTTMWHLVTTTQTVWVKPTDQAVFVPVSGSSAHSSHSSAASASAAHTSEQEIVVESAKASSARSSTATAITSAHSSSHSSSHASAASTPSSIGSSSRLATSTLSASSGSIVSSSSSAEHTSHTLGSSAASSRSMISSTTSSAHTSLESSLTVEDFTSTRHTSSAKASSAAPSPSAGLPPVPSRIMAGYYPDWSSWYLAPEKVDFSKFDILDFAFAIPTEAGGLEFTQYDSSDLLHRLVKAAHAHGKRVKLSIGGWTGSKFFSPIAADAARRKVFVESMTDAYSTYNLDGIDIDWEYPGAGGAGGNIVSGQDSSNFLLMLQDLRAALPKGALITLATQVWPFTGSNGSPLSDVRGFAAVIDWILVMNYDIWGSSSTPGPNAPLSDACGNSTQPLANAYASVSSWTQAGLDPSQITIGVPAYGYLQQSWATSLRQRDVQEPVNTTWPTRERRGMEKRYTTVSSGWSTTEGQVMWHDLVSQGALEKQWDGQWVGAGGFERIWDECSSTPFLKSTQSSQIVTYDDPQSMSLKGQFAAQAGLRGCNVFSVDGDWTNGEWPLTDAVRSGLGL